MQGIMFDEEAKQQNKTKLELIAFQFLSYKSISERGYYFFFSPPYRVTNSQGNPGNPGKVKE